MIRVRRRQAEDVPVIVSWVPDAAALHRFAGPRLTWPLTSQQMINGAAENRTAWVMTDGDEPVGHFELTSIGTSVRLGRVLLDPVRRGRGLGNQLVAAALEQAKILGASEVRLNVVADNVVAWRVYDRLGFTSSPQQDRTDILSMIRPL
ncbi:GNAT family N-acetyltransferase [Modestobacter sp. SYSU DS0657]